jgi:hypothetical protein
MCLRRRSRRLGKSRGTSNAKVRIDLPRSSRLRGATVFSDYCFEPLRRASGDVIEKLIEAGVSRVIHIEATPELWNRWNPVDTVTWLQTWSQDYEDNLLTTLRERERRGRVTLLRAHRLHYAPSVRHDYTLVCWEPVS